MRTEKTPNKDGHLVKEQRGCACWGKRASQRQTPGPVLEPEVSQSPVHTADWGNGWVGMPLSSNTSLSVYVEHADPPDVSVPLFSCWSVFGVLSGYIPLCVHNENVHLAFPSVISVDSTFKFFLVFATETLVTLSGWNTWVSVSPPRKVKRGKSFLN